MTLTDEARQFIKRCLSDTGYLCRELLGYNYDEDAGGQKVNVGKGGIVDYGKHQEAIELLDDPEISHKLIIMPRESRKSTILQGFCIRHVLLNPDIRIAYVARTDDMMAQKVLAIRNQLEREEITALFGPQRGDKWEESVFTVKGRKDVGLQNATVTGFSMDSMPHGGRFNIILLDDFIDETNVTTPEQNKKSKDKWMNLQPLLARGGILVYVGTTWADDDLGNDLQASPLFAPPKGGQIVCGAGVRVIHDSNGKLDLEVVETGLNFQHLTIEYLRQKLHGMSLRGQYDIFVRQYLNEATSRSSSMFQRRYFKSVQWGEDMRELSGYLLTDTAISDKEESCYSVVAYVGIDAGDNLYLLDLRIGHWDPTEFVNNFFACLEEWQQRTNHCGECWEDVALASAYRDSIENDARARRTRLRTIEQRRPPSSQKRGRIMRLQPVMANGRFWVVDTVPRTFVDVDGEKELWNPKGFFNARVKAYEPSGELIDEFLRPTAKKDIPDTLAMVLEHEKTKTGHHKRMCFYKPWRPKDGARSLTQRRQDAYHRAEYQQEPRGDWWEDTLNRHGIT